MTKPQHLKQPDYTMHTDTVAVLVISTWPKVFGYLFYRPLKAGLQPAAHCRRVANPSRAMLENLWASTYSSSFGYKILLFGIYLRFGACNLGFHFFCDFRLNLIDN